MESMKMPGSYSIWIVSPPNYPYSRCFEEVALGLHEAFKVLGHDAPVITDPHAVQGTAIVLGANLLQMVSIPSRPLILYNLEQLDENPDWLTPAYLQLLKQYPVWDYNHLNIETLASYGIEASYCGLGYMPALSRIEPAIVKDIDVLFIGTISPRRNLLLRALADFNALIGYDVWGSERDALIARAKIIVNIHYYETGLFEMVRATYLLSNRKCIVSEKGKDKRLEDSLAKGVSFVAYENLVENCAYLLDNEPIRQKLEQTGFEIFAQKSQVALLKAALESTRGK